MNLTTAQMAGKPKKIGHLGDKSVFGITTKGGLNLVVAPKDGGFETLGTGPHMAIAKHIARKRAPDVAFTELSKSEYVDERAYLHLVPKYERLTDRIAEVLHALAAK